MKALSRSLYLKPDLVMDTVDTQETKYKDWGVELRPALVDKIVESAIIADRKKIVAALEAQARTVDGPQSATWLRAATFVRCLD